MITVFMLPAGKGDFFVIEYGDNENKHYIFIDGGDISTRSVYKKILMDFCTKKKTIDAMIFTHIDDDHIAGALSAILSIQELPNIKKIYLNTGENVEKRIEVFKWGEYPEQREKDYLHLPHKQHSISQALSLIGLLTVRGLSDKIAPATCLGDEISVDGAVIKFISPGELQLRKYFTRWKEEGKEQHVQHMGEQKEPIKDLAAYINVEVTEDTSVTNGSSMAFIVECEGKKMAFLGDAHPSVCEDGVLRFYPDGTSVDFIKVPHHGSRYNYSKRMYDLLLTDYFLLSTKGTKAHPDPVFLAKLFFQYPNARLLCNSDWMKRYGFTDDDKKKYLLGNDPQIIYLKNAKCLSDGLMVKGIFTS